jgi:hypothetical protein
MHDAFTHSIFSMFQAPASSSTAADAEKKDAAAAHKKME